MATWEQKRKERDTRQPSVHTLERLEAEAGGSIINRDDEGRYSEGWYKIPNRGVPGHRIEEHLIVLKSIIQERMRKKKGVVVKLVD